MIDNLYYQLKRLETLADILVSQKVKELKKSLPNKYLCMTMHRPSNVDDKEVLTSLLKAINEVASEAPVIFPCHPRTRKNIERFGLSHLFGGSSQTKSKISSGIILTEPLGYNDFLYLWKDAAGVLTDSGGLQEETRLILVIIFYFVFLPVIIL